ncbi:DJ-1/PfpI family protein [Candidatus Phytoplasma melaleucae]|uniref:DJ-1/PfpI family protein n=1 Tax=Candidatus Phytoplasma melaleucae TaxID=2982630 RepID=A0ABT9DCS4_9MOLU|nr:DJ-1/PfpI family protein ['Melaleuca sp.' phytoplasma]MDO8167926.1 DJ-1/PfpI family protein ['Melaleuca sp.' phytoplasma]
MVKGLLILYNGFEDTEAVTTRAIIKQNAFDVITCAPNNSLQVVSSQELHVKADMHIDKVVCDEYGFLIIPGGPYVQNLLRSNNQDLHKVLNIIKSFAEKKKIIAAICAAPSFLGRIGLLQNHSFTCYPGYESNITGGIYCSNCKTVVSDNFITSQSPLTVFDFANRLLDKLNIYNY